MSEIPFHSTIFGRRFFEGQLPDLIDALRALAPQTRRADETCMSCIFCEITIKGTGGLCRRRTPERTDAGVSTWPTVRRMDWCGEYRRRAS